MDAEKDLYLGVVDRLEPDITGIDAVHGWASIAISMKRQADALERVADGLKLVGRLIVITMLGGVTGYALAFFTARP